MSVLKTKIMCTFFLKKQIYLAHIWKLLIGTLSIFKSNKNLSGYSKIKIFFIYSRITVRLTFEFRVGDFLKSTRHLYTAASLSPTFCKTSIAGCMDTRKSARPSSVLSSDQWDPVVVDLDPSGDLDTEFAGLLRLAS